MLPLSIGCSALILACRRTRVVVLSGRLSLLMRRGTVGVSVGSGGLLFRFRSLAMILARFCAL